MKLTTTLGVAVALAIVLSGCSSKGGTQGEGDVAGTGVDGSGAAGGAGGPKINRYGTGGAGGSGSRYGAYGSEGEGGGAGRNGLTGDPELDNATGPLAKRVVYFMYDSFEVKPEYRAVVSAHAAYLAAHPGRNVVLEGHADERGTQEYNVALGEQRAQAVARMLQLQGAANGQIQVVSFGEEKPADTGHDEPAWQQNRRVELSYQGH